MSSLIPPLQLTGHLGTDTKPGSLGQHMGQEAWLKEPRTAGDLAGELGGGPGTVIAGAR